MKRGWPHAGAQWKELGPGQQELQGVETGQPSRCVCGWAGCPGQYHRQGMQVEEG